MILCTTTIALLSKNNLQQIVFYRIVGILPLDSSEPFFTWTCTWWSSWLNCQCPNRSPQFGRKRSIQSSSCFVDYFASNVFAYAKLLEFLDCTIRSITPSYWTLCVLLVVIMHTTVIEHTSSISVNCLFSRYFSRVPNFQQCYFSSLDPAINSKISGD